MSIVKKAIVTGGAGFIGSHLCCALNMQNIRVLAFDDLSVGKASNLDSGIDLIKDDVLNMESLKEAALGCDIMFHLAARVTIRGSVETYLEDSKTNLLGTLSAIKAASQAGCKAVIFASSMAVYADSPTPCPLSESYLIEPISPYGISKSAAEKYLFMLGPKVGLRTAALRLFNTFGPGQVFTPYVGVITIFIHRLLEGLPPVIFGDGEQRRDFIHVDDVIKAFLAVMNSDINGIAINIGTQTATSVNQIAEMLTAKIAPSMKPVREPARPEELRNSVADITLAKKLFGFDPKARLETYIDEVFSEIKRR